MTEDFVEKSIMTSPDPCPMKIYSQGLERINEQISSLGDTAHSLLKITELNKMIR